MERRSNLAAIKRRLLEKRESETLYQRIAALLVAKGVARSLAEKIIEDFSLRGGEISALQESLVQWIHTAGELSFPARLALVGPTGVGKSTTLLKLAEHYQKKGKKIALVTLDREKQGARMQLEAYASLWNLPLYDKVEGVEGDLILIDTSGCNFYHPYRVEALGEELAACGSPDILLTLSAATKDVDLYGAIHQFSSLSPHALAFTKLDETLASGVLLNVSAKTEIPIRYVTYGYPLPGELQLADPYQIAHKILTDFNQEEFNYLRQLTLFD